MQAQILNLLKDMQKDMDLGDLLISHQPEVIEFMAHETMILGAERSKASLSIIRDCRVRSFYELWKRRASSFDKGRRITAL